MNPPDDQRLLRESEEKYRALYESSRDALMILEPPSWGFTSGNPATVEMFQAKDEQEFISYGPGHLSPERQPDGRDSGEKAGEMIGTALREGSHFFEWTHKRIHGEEFPATVLLTRMEQGGRSFLQATVRDITAQKRAEAALKESEEQFRLLVQNQGEGIGMADLEERFTFANPAAEAIFGVPPGKLVGRRLEDFMTPEQYAGVLEQTWKRNYGERSTYDLEIVRADGERRNLLVTACPRNDPQGRFIGSFGIFRDITEHKRAEQQLRERMKELQAFYRLAELTEREGITLDELYQELTDVLPKSWQYPEIACARIVVGDREFRTKNFRESGWMQSAPVKASGSVAGRIEVGYLEERPEQDEGPFLKEERRLIDAIAERLGHITERKRAEEGLIKRTVELEVSNKELESFAYSVSHDLRAPLRTIDGFSHALLEDYDDKLDVQGKDYLRRVRAATQMMAQLIDDMLKISRITRTEMNVEKVNLTQIARSVIDELQKSQPERLINIKIADGLEDTADARLMRVALENLLGNAWKFTGKQAEAVIEFGSTQEGGRKVYFIRDNGAGFDMAYADKLFAPFQRLHTMEEYPGTGIGLATVRRIINRHGGRVWAEGQVDKGATFYFSLQG